MLWSAQRSAARRMLSPRLPSGRFYFKPVRYTDRLEALLPSKQSVPAYRLLSPDGTLCSSYKPDRRLATALYRSMTRWSVFDAVMNDAQRQGRISFYLTSSGEEAVSYGSASALQADDIVYAQYREGGVLEWRRYPMQSLVDQCFGNERDAGKGRQMPVHYGSAEHFYHTVSSPLGTQIPQAAGAGYRLRLDSPSRIAICYFGEGAASEGDFHAGMNFAAVLGCHTLFLCRNNEWAISTPLSEQYSGDGIVVRGPAYGMAAFRVDGNDVFAMHEAVRQARQMIIGEHRPVLIEAMTYRLGHHSTSDDSYAYRDREVLCSRHTCGVGGGTASSRSSNRPIASLSRIAQME